MQTSFEERIRLAEQAIAAEKGPFQFFALVLREHGVGNWDIVACAAWMEDDILASLEYVFDRLKRFLTKEELLRVARVVIVKESDVRLQSLRNTVAVEHGLQRYQEGEFLGQEIRKAWIITSRAAA